jgi:hypothetical protein
MEAQDEDFEARLRALEGWRAEKVGVEKRISTISAWGRRGRGQGGGGEGEGAGWGIGVQWTPGECGFRNPSPA